MELPDCPPGAEGYEDSVIEVAKKQPSYEDTSTKAEQEFKEHLNSLKIKVENGDTRCMVERRGRDISGKWIYLCYPCAAVCSGECVLQTHISGKKHKTKLALRNVWPMSIFEEHPFIVNEKGGNATNKTGATEKILQKMAEEVDLHNKDPSDLDQKYNKYRTVRCHIQDSIDAIKFPLLGVEYLVEHPPEEAHHEPCYICTLCTKQGHPRTIVNHLTCFWHRFNYLLRHFPKATTALTPYRQRAQYRDGVSLIVNRLAQRVEDTYGRMRPVNIDKDEYEKNKERIHSWIFKSHHYSETDGMTFEEVVDIGLINSLNKEESSKTSQKTPPVVAAPSKTSFNQFTRSSRRRERRAGSPDSLSDVSDELAPRRAPRPRPDHCSPRGRYEEKPRYEPYPDHRHKSPYRSRYALKHDPENSKQFDKALWDKKAPNHDHKLKLATEKRKAAEESAKKTLAYHEKNPEKHPLYPEEWKKFWNRRYKEIQAEGKDASKYDFKPEWIVYWTARMKELHEQELRVNIIEIYRKLCMSPPPLDAARHSPREPDPKRKGSEPRRRSPERRRSPLDTRRRLPEPRRRSPELRRSPIERHDYRRRTADYRHGGSMDRRHSPPRRLPVRSRSPHSRARSPARTHITLESVRRSRSPLSRREQASRNRSPQYDNPPPPHRPPAMQTVMISDDELKPDDGLSPWNSDNDLDSLGSLPDASSPPRARSRAGSLASHASRRAWDYSAHSAHSAYSAYSAHPAHPARGADPNDLGPPENIVATLRLLVALEDYLGSLGPKIVDLMTEALKMEKDKANSSEELLEREAALVLIETAKEKLKGAVQAGLVAPQAAPALRTALVRAAATLHAADTRAQRNKKLAASKPAAATGAAAVPVAGVGAVDRAQIAQQMAAALVAQGKTDVSSEELAQLVDAVVGMAEAKKREAEVKKKVEARALADKASRPPPPPPRPRPQSGTASALQMLQSAYDENDKKIEKEDAPDAMDGLSDSDLETLLKNFNELSAEEQHSLIAYLKKLEAREPTRVERLRQYVSAADHTRAKDAPPRQDDVIPVAIESDDDDYTVEDIFKSATQKVKEDQIRQEMEIVKKSLEESKATPPQAESPKPDDVPIVDLTKNLSAATDLLALVHASIQSTSSANPALTNQTADVVTSNTQPRSFGDRPEAVATPIETIKPLMQITPLIPIVRNQQASIPNNQGFRPQIQMNLAGNRNVQNKPYNSPQWDQSMSMSDNVVSSNMTDNRGPMGNISDNRGPMSNMSDISGAMSNMSDNRGPMMSVNRGPMMSDNRGPMMSDNRGPMMSDNRGPMSNLSDNRGLMMSDNRGPMMSDNRAPMMSDNRSPMNNMSDNRGPMNNMSDNRGPMNNMSDNRGPMNNMSDNRGPMNHMQDNRNIGNMDSQGPMSNMDEGRPISNMMDNRPINNMQDNRSSMANMKDNRSLMGNMPENRGLMNNRGPVMQDNMGFNRGSVNNMQNQSNMKTLQNQGNINNMPDSRMNMQDNRPMGGGFNNYGRGQNNQGPRANFGNARMQDNFGQNQQQYGNFDHGKRGRGRGNFGGRGRGRGYY